MPNLDDSIEELTTSLQELAASRAEGQCITEETPPSTLSTGELTFSKEVESFVQKNRDYATKTRLVSEGTF